MHFLAISRAASYWVLESSEMGVMSLGLINSEHDSGALPAIAPVAVGANTRVMVLSRAHL